jgi:glycosyltransferase involved in cell wall biosynthesis/4-amino-4-deoxy-L-arabinose transferase-like glycosyltransferase
MIDLSVVVPVFNGEPFIERTIGELIEHVASLDEPTELIVIDDGSTDRTAEIIEEAVDGAPVPVKFLRSPQNEGKGAAICRGMAVAHGRYRVFLDADLAYSPRSISDVRAKLAEGADVVIGSRVHPDSTYQVKPSFFRYLYTRHVAGRLFNWVVRLFLLPGVFDSQAGLKGFTTEAADAIFGGWLPVGFSFDLGVLSRARHERLSIEQIPVKYRYDSEPTTVRFMNDTVAALYDLAVVRLRIGGEYSKKGLGRLTAWTGRQLSRARTAAMSPRATAAGVAVAGLGLVGHAVFRTTIPNNSLAMMCWLVAFAGLLLVARRSDSSLPSDNRPVFETGGEFGIFVLIFGLAAILRLWNLSEIPPTIHGDSAECGIQGLDILLGKVGDVFGFSGWYFTPYPAHLPYTASFALVGTSVLGLRLPSAVVGLLSLIPLYFLVRGWLGPRAAQIATTLFALSHTAIHFSRIGLWNIQSLFLELVAFAFLAAALRKSSAALASCAGIAAGLGFYTYTGGRLILVVSVAVLAIQLLLGPRRRLLHVSGFAAAGFAVAMTPMLVNYATDPDALAADRSGSVFVLAEFNREHVESVTGQTSPSGILRVQAVQSLKGFFNQGDRSGQYGGDALASPTTAALMLAGFLLAFVRFRETESRLLLLWAGLGLLLGSVLIIDPPSHTRLIVLFPVPFILAALTLETMFRWLDRSGGRWMRLLIFAACALVIGQAAVFNLGGYRRYVEQTGEEGQVWDVVKVIERFGENHDYYFFGGPTMEASSPGLRLLAGNHWIVNGYTTTDIPRILNQNTVFIIPALLPELEPQMRNVGTVITERFPNSKREIVGEAHNPQLILYVASNGGHQPPGGPGAEVSR